MSKPTQPLIDELAAACRSIIFSADMELADQTEEECWTASLHRQDLEKLRKALARYDAEQAKPHHLPTCGTAYRGCDPECPKDLAEQAAR